MVLYLPSSIWYDKALTIDPYYVDALVGKGLALDSLGQYQEAITLLDKALAIDPNDASARGGKMVVLLHKLTSPKGTNP